MGAQIQLQLLAWLQVKRAGYQQAEACHADVENVGEDPGPSRLPIRVEWAQGDWPAAGHGIALMAALFATVPGNILWSLQKI